MGMELSVIPRVVPADAWARIDEQLRSRGLQPCLAMIDGQLAFPDEIPSSDWRELRLRLPAGMVTIARQKDRIRIVIWGNAEAGLIAIRDAATWAIALVTDGKIETDAGHTDANSFAAARLSTGAGNPDGDGS